MKDLQILWATMKYHWRRMVKLFKPQVMMTDGNGEWYYDCSYQRILYWNAYRRWQTKRFDRGQVNVGTDLFEEDTHLSSKTKR